MVDMASIGQKPMLGAKGGRSFKVYQRESKIKNEGVKRRLKCLKVRILGIKQLTRDNDYTNMK